MKGNFFKKYFNILFLILIFLSILFLGKSNMDKLRQTSGSNSPEQNTSKVNSSEQKEMITVVVDAGHGGRDPGKIGVNNVQEKDVNLCIALKLKKFLEQNDIHVIMTREEDIGLYSESDSNKKAADMRKRVDLINNSNAILAISIHQNSFTQESIWGAQVFYYADSKNGKEYAKVMQDQLKKSLKDGNKREAKANDTYYLLKKTKCPFVIVECGYLSNNKEAAKLIDDTYQERLAWAIHLGIISYMNQIREE